MLKGEEDLDPELEEGSQFDTAADLIREPVPVAYNPANPHRDVRLHLRRRMPPLDLQPLAAGAGILRRLSSIGLTATPSKQTLGFFNQNLVMEYNHEQAVADGVNVDFDVYRIRTQITEQGSKRRGRAVRRQARPADPRRPLGEARRRPDLRRHGPRPRRGRRGPDPHGRPHLQEKLFTEIFPGRTEVPKTLIYAKDDSHADDIVQIVREEFGKGNDFCAEDHLQDRHGPRRDEGDRPGRTGGRRGHVQVDRGEAGGPALVVPQQLQPAHRRDRGHDRHRHRHQAAGNRDVHARGQEPELLRADEGPRRAGDQRDRLPGRDAGRAEQDPLRHRGLRRRL